MTTHRFNDRPVDSYVGLAVLFITSFFVFHWIYGYVISFQSETNDCYFVFGCSFLLEFLDHPAGPLRYAGRFLGQFYHYQWLGSLIMSACVTCFGLLFHRVLAKLDGTVPVFQTLLPCVLLLALHTSTIYVIHDTLGLCASCASFLGYLSLRGKLARRVYALVATPIVYLFLGCYAWFFVVWVLAFEWLDGPLRSGLSFNVVYLVFSIAVPLAAWRWVFPISLRSALMCPIMFDPPFRTGSSSFTVAYFVVDGLLLVVLTALLLLIPFWGRWSSGTRFVGFWRVRPGKWSRVALVVSLPVLIILLHFIRYDASLATVVACRQLYKQKQWDALLGKAKKNPRGNLRVQFMTNFALSQKGKLLDEMFSYPQPWGTRGLVLNFSGLPVLSPAADDTGKGMYNSDLFYEMGHVNAAFRHAYNCMTVRGPTYEIMKRMAQCSMAIGNYDTAAKYLNVLEGTLFHRGFARRYKAIIADPNAAEREFGDLRKRLPVSDDHIYQHPAMPFVFLLDARPDNRMALDYLMAWFLLEKSESSITSICCPEGIRYFRSAGYTTIPTHCQEALLMWERVERTRADLQGYRCDEATVARVDKFYQDLSPYLAWSQVSEHARELYGDMYLFYHFFVTTPGEAQWTLPAHGGFDGTSRHE